MSDFLQPKYFKTLQFLLRILIMIIFKPLIYPGNKIYIIKKVCLNLFFSLQPHVPLSCQMYKIIVAFADL